MSLSIHVRETVTKHSPAERAGLQLTVSAEGPDKSVVAERTRAVLREVTDELARGEQAGAVRRWSTDRVTTSSHRPWVNDGQRLALLHRASAQVHARFMDFEHLADVVQRWSEIDEVAVEQVEWELTASTKETVETALRTRAVHTATAKAQEYARAAGLGAVHPTSIVDNAGLDGGAGPFARHEGYAVSSGVEVPHFRFSPSDIAVAVTIEMEFAAT